MVSETLAKFSLIALSYIIGEVCANLALILGSGLDKLHRQPRIQRANKGLNRRACNFPRLGYAGPSFHITFVR
jgi:hypothetical protein